MGPRKRDGKRDEVATGNRGLTLMEADTSGPMQDSAVVVPPFVADGPEPSVKNVEVAGADTKGEARQLAQEAVWQNARKLVKELVERPGGNYLAVKFLFEFAGLMSMEEQKESKGDLKALMQDLLNRPKTGLAKQTSDAKLNLCNGDGTHNSQS